MPDYRFPKSYADRVARLRVPCGFLLVAAFAWFSQPDAHSLAAGIPISVVGLLIRAWAAGHLAKNERLATSGPYAHLRNPLYLGTLGVAAGLVIAAREPWLAPLFGAVFVLIYWPAIEQEEQHLRKLFPEFERYAQQVPALRPRLRGIPAEGRFRWGLYWKNQEYNAALGFAAGVAFLVWKAGLLPF